MSYANKVMKRAVKADKKSNNKSAASTGMRKASPNKRKPTKKKKVYK